MSKYITTYSKGTEERNRLEKSVLNMYNKSYRKKDSIANHLKRYDYDATLGKTVFHRTVLFNDLTISEKEVKKIIEDNMEDYTDSIICISRKQADCFCKTK